MSTKQFGCFFCAGKATAEDAPCSTCGKPLNVGQELLGQAIEMYRPLRVLGRGFYGWTLCVQDEYQPFAMKIVPLHRFSARHQLKDSEARALVTCSQHRNIARFSRAFDAQVRVLDAEVPVFCMLFDFIPNARPLSKVVADENLRLTQADVVAILAGIASGLARMHANGLWHDDLHDDNVLVRTVQPDENLPERVEAKIIDFGSAEPRRPDEPEHGDRGDYFYLGKHIYSVVARYEEGILTGRTQSDRTFARRLRHLARQIGDRNVSRRSLEPADVAVRIRASLREVQGGSEFPPVEQMLQERTLSFKEPLGNSNALNLAHGYRGHNSDLRKEVYWPLSFLDHGDLGS